jgi:hypothetical protein
MFPYGSGFWLHFLNASCQRRRDSTGLGVVLGTLLPTEVEVAGFSEDDFYQRVCLWLQKHESMGRLECWRCVTSLPFRLQDLLELLELFSGETEEPKVLFL